MRFDELCLDPLMMRALNKMGFVELTPVQEATYFVFKDGKDLCALAETGSGKTAACAVPLVQGIDKSFDGIQGLVLVPTRELALQYVDAIDQVAKYMDVVPFAICGGFSKEIQRAKLKHGVDILVATPGRLIDFIYDCEISLSNVRTVILDEADELLKIGFLDDIKFILSCIVHKHQTVMFSATMSDEIKGLANDCLCDAEHISLIKERSAPVSLAHHFSYVNINDKYKELLNYSKHENVDQMIIFCNSRHGVDKLFKLLRKDLNGVEFVHAGLSQDKRSSLFRQLKAKRIKYLIATDVAGRGLDFSRITHVVNWELPRDSEQYTHRTGRTGRNNKKGKAMTFITKRDLRSLNKLIKDKDISPIWQGKDPLANGLPKLKSGTKNKYQWTNRNKKRKKIKHNEPKTK